MKQSKISVGIACLIMSSSFAALAGGPAPVAQNNKMFTVYTNLNGDASMLAGDINKTPAGDKNNGLRLSGGANIGLGAKLSEKANAFVQLSAAGAPDVGYTLAQETDPSLSLGEHFVLDKAYANYNLGKFVVQAGYMGMIDMSTFVTSNLNAWRPTTAGFNIDAVTNLFARNIISKGMSPVIGTDSSYNATAAAVGTQMGKFYATAMYSVNREDAKDSAKDSGFLGKNSYNTIDAQLGFKTDKVSVTGNFSSSNDLNQPKRSNLMNIQAAYKLGKIVLTAGYDNYADKADLEGNGTGYKENAFTAGASYNLDLFGLNHTWQVNWMMDDNGKDTATPKDDKDPSNIIQVNDIIPVFNKHLNVIPYFVTTLNAAGVKTGTKESDTQFGVAFQGLWSVNV